MLIGSVLLPQIQLADASGKSPYDSGYDHGCMMRIYPIHHIGTLTNQTRVQAPILMNLCKDIMQATIIVQMMIVLSGGSQTDTDRESSNSDDGTQDLDETTSSPNPSTDDRYYEGYDWTGVCNDAHRYGYMPMGSQPCDTTLITPDGNALTSQGKQVMEAPLCPRGQGVIGLLEYIHGPIPDNLESELATACGWSNQDNQSPSQNTDREQTDNSRSLDRPKTDGFDWTGICNTLQRALYSSCSSLVNNDGSLTSEVHTQCIVYEMVHYWLLERALLLQLCLALL